MIHLSWLAVLHIPDNHFLISKYDSSNGIKEWIPVQITTGNNFLFLSVYKIIHFWAFQTMYLKTLSCVLYSLMKYMQTSENEYDTVMFVTFLLIDNYILYDAYLLYSSAAL